MQSTLQSQIMFKSQTKIGKLILADIKIYSKAKQSRQCITGIKVYIYIYRSVEQWRRVDSRNRYTHILAIYFQKGKNTTQWKKSFPRYDI